MTIEFLSHENIEEALDFAEKSHGDSGWKEYAFDRSVLRRNLIKMIGNPIYFTCLYRRHGVLIGYWFASLVSFLFSDAPLGSENGIYITPSQRGGIAAFMMYKEFKAWCDKNNVEPVAEVHFGDTESNEKAYSFFEGVGMVECGRIFRGGRNGLQKRG